MLLRTQKAHETPKVYYIYSRGAALLMKGWLNPNKIEDHSEGATAPAATWGEVSCRQKLHQTPKDIPKFCIHSRGAALLTKGWMITQYAC